MLLYWEQFISKSISFVMEVIFWLKSSHYCASHSSEIVIMQKITIKFIMPNVVLDVEMLNILVPSIGLSFSRPVLAVTRYKPSILRWWASPSNKFGIMLRVKKKFIMLNVVMLNVEMLNVIVPSIRLSFLLPSASGDKVQTIHLKMMSPLCCR